MSLHALRMLLGLFGLLGLFAVSLGGATGCSGSGAAVSVRWRIADVGTGPLDPASVADSSGACCRRPDQGLCADQVGWRITRVELVLIDQSDNAPLATPPPGLDAACSARELTTPFELPTGNFAIALRAYDPAMPHAIEAVSPSPEIRTLHPAEIVNLDVVQLSVGP